MTASKALLSKAAQDVAIREGERYEAAGGIMKRDRLHQSNIVKTVGSAVEAIVLALCYLVAGPGGASAERLPVKTYTTADGLANNRISRIVRDSRGYLWFCTENGLSRFDGYKFTNYAAEQGLPAGEVNDLLETRSGDYWIATSNGLCRYNPKGLPLPYGRESPQSAPMFVVYRLDGDDVGMIERGGGARLLLEAAQSVGVRGEFGGQQLERDLPPQSRVAGEVNFSHPARAQQR